MNWIRKINPSVRCAGQGPWKKDFVEPLRQLYDHELVIFENGICEVELGRCNFKFLPDSWLIIPPGLSHTSRAVSDKVQRRWVHFDWLDSVSCNQPPICKYSPELPEPDLLRNAPDFVPEIFLKGTFSRREADVLYALLDSLELRLQHSCDVERLTAKSILQEILLRLFTGASGRDKLKFPSVNTDAFKVKMLLDQMPDTETSIRDLLASLGKSYEHLCRRFREEYNLTPVEYLNKLRIETAKKLLSNNSLNISQIAEKCGYSNAGYFCRCFKKSTGVVCSDYRLK